MEQIRWGINIPKKTINKKFFLIKDNHNINNDEIQSDDIKKTTSERYKDSFIKEPVCIQ